MTPDQLISEGYRRQCEQLHGEGCGKGGHNWANTVADIVNFEYNRRISSILDYGCGQGVLKKQLIAGDVRINTKKQDIDIREYEPSNPDKSALPAPADLVVCNDVLEHVEEELIDNVIQHLYDLTNIACFVTIGLNPSTAILMDGRNWHLTHFGSTEEGWLEGRIWWVERLKKWPWRVEELRMRRKIWLELLLVKVEARR